MSLITEEICIDFHILWSENVSFIFDCHYACPLYTYQCLVRLLYRFTVSNDMMLVRLRQVELGVVWEPRQRWVTSRGYSWHVIAITAAKVSLIGYGGAAN